MENGEKKSLKVLFVTRWYPNKYDPQLGVFVRKHALAAALDCQVAVLYIAQDAAEQNMFRLEEEKQDGIAEFRLYFKPSRSGIGFLDKGINLVYFFLYFHLATRFIHRKWGRQDITHAVILGRTAMAARMTQILRSIPFAVSEHWSGYATGSFANRSGAWKNLVRRLARRASFVTAPSNFLLEKMKQSGIGGKLVVIPNVIDVPAQEIPASQDGFVRILVVADLVDEIKNISGILDAYGNLDPGSQTLQLDIVGDGPDRTLLEIKAEKIQRQEAVIRFHGRRDNKEVYGFLSSCNFLVMNSRIETFSMICGEALACGRPVVATRCGGPEEYLSSSCGILVQPGNSQELIQAMQRMILESGSYPPAQLRAVASQFVPERIGQMLNELYRNSAKPLK